jgi:polar amino acid transport system substrate-binding protein
LLLVAVMLSPPLSAADCGFTLRIAAHGVWREPHTAQYENQRDQVILTHVAQHLHWCLSWEQRETNITRRLAMIRDGEVDALIGASKTDERSVYSRFSSPYRDESVLLFVRDGDLAKYNAIDSFDALLESRAMLIAVRDSWLGPDYARHRQALLGTHRVDEVDTYVQGRGMLQLRRGDVLIAPDTFGDFLRVDPNQGISQLDWEPYRSPVYFMFSRKTISRDRVLEFNKALAEVMRSEPVGN